MRNDVTNINLYRKEKYVHTPEHTYIHNCIRTYTHKFMLTYRQILVDVNTTIRSYSCTRAYKLEYVGQEKAADIL